MSDVSHRTTAAEDDSVQAGVVRSAGVVSGAVLLSRLTGLAREIAFANFFGAGFAYDAYLAAFRIPNLTRDLLAEGALSSAFVTIFSKQLTLENGRAKAFELSNRLTTALVPALIALCAAAIWLAPEIVDLMFPGFAAVPGKKELTVLLTQVMTPYLLFVSLAAKSMGVLNSVGRFGIPALASAVFNLTSLAVGLACAFLVAPRLGYEPIAGMAAGTLVGGLCQYVWQAPSLRRIGLRFRPDLALKDPALRQVLRLMAPAVAGAASVQVNVVVNSIFASQIADASGQIIDGPVSWLGYAFRFMQLPLGLFGVALASATLPAIAKSAARGDRDEFRKTLSSSLRVLFLLTVPASVGLIVLGRSIVGVIYQHGRFGPADTEQTALALSYYCLGLAGYAAIKLLTPAFYALDEVRTPATISALSIALNYALNWLFVRRLGWGHEGLALSTSLVACLTFIALFVAMRRRVGGLEDSRLGLSFAKVCCAALAMGTICRLSSSVIAGQFGETFSARLLDLGVSIPLGLAALYFACRALGVSELGLAQRALLSRLKR